MIQSAVDARILPVQDERRRSPRQPTQVAARLRPLGSEGCAVRILNLSRHGFMAECSADLECGTRVWLILPGRERLNAVVRWTQGGRIGAEFAEPIDLPAL